MKTTTVIMLLLGALLAPTGPVHAQPLARCTYEQGVTKPQDSIAACTAVINAGGLSREDLARAYSNRCAALGDLGEHEKALSDCTKAIELDPIAYRAYYNRGRAYVPKGQLDRAVQDFDQAIRLKPDFAFAYNKRGLAYHYKGQLNRAIRDHDQAIRLKPDYAEAYVSRALAYYKMGQYDRAIQDYDQAIRLKPNDASAYVGRGLAYDDKGQPDRAIQDYDQAIRLKPDYAEAYVGRGLAYDDKGQYDRAIQDYDQAIRLKPDFADAYYNRGVAYAGKGELDRAIQDYDQAIRLNPDDAEAFNGRGVARNHKGLYDRAIEDLNRALQLNRSHAKAWGNRGFSYLKKGTLRDLDQAIADSEQALKLDPNLTYVRTNLDEARRAKETLLAQAAAVKNGRRIALVIGNSVYANEALLPNAVHDAEDVAAALKSLGYEIFGYPKANFTKADLEREIESFRKASIGATAAIVWYSGHGREALDKDDPNSRDWIIPVEAVIKTAEDVGKRSVSLDTLKTAVRGAKDLRLVVVDACRDTASYTGFRGATRFRDPDKLDGVVIVYSTSPGDRARDGQGRNSPFAQAFLEAVRAKPNADVRLLFADVAGRTKKLTGTPPQRPIVESGLETGDTVALGR